MAGRILTSVLPTNWVIRPPPVLSVGMGFEFDLAKDRINRTKHGYGLASGEDVLRRVAWPIGMAPPVVGLEEVGRDDGEVRFRILTLDHECQLVDFVFTIRGTLGNDYRLRAISYRRAYEPELMTLYESHVSFEECLSWLHQCIDDELAPGTVRWPLAESLDGPRRQFLMRPARPIAMATALLDHASATIVQYARGRPLEDSEARDAQGFARVVVRLNFRSEVGEAVFDYLFNGCRGLRFYYAVAPLLGALLTRRLIRVLEPLLGPLLVGLEGADRERARASYLGMTAKLWPNERELQLAPVGSAPTEVDIGRWRHACEAWRFNAMNEDSKACWGIQVPRPRSFEIKGAFVNAAGSEWLPESKERRSEEIYQWGWS